jgi:hypothetical protein
MEMTHRAFGPVSGANELLWQVVFGDERPVPIGLQAPSKSSPKAAKQRLRAGIQ